jgi:hypothetical protein
MGNIKRNRSNHPESVPWKLFWPLWFQKNLRNIASIKYQWLVFLYVPIIWGMFHIPEGSETDTPWISATLGLGSLFGGFITLALGRIYARTKLTEESGKNFLDTDK